MEGKILAFFLAVDALLWLLKRRPKSSIARSALTFFGPTPRSGQSWASFQLSWAMYSFGWLCQFALVLAVL
jgi:hypothetical protein